MTQTQRPEGVSRRNVLKGIGGAALLTGVGGAFLAACGDDDAPDEEGGSSTTAKPAEGGTIALSHPYSEVPIVAVVKRLTEAAATAEGYEFLGDPTQGGAIDDQIATLESWVTQGVTAICAVPTDEAAINPIAQNAIDAGLIWTTYALESEVSYGGVLFPPEESGQIIADHSVAWIEDLGIDANVLIMTQTGIPAGAPRWEVPQAALEAAGAKIVAVQDANDQAGGQELTETVLRANPELNVVIGMNDDGALGAVQAFRNANKDPNVCYIAGQDGSLDALKAIQDGGFFKATAALRIRDIAQGIVDLSLELIESRPKQGDAKVNKLIVPVLVAQDKKDELAGLIADLEG